MACNRVNVLLRWKSTMVALLTIACVTLVIPAHPTPEMNSVRLALHVWATGLLNGDDAAIASVVHDDMTTSEGENRAKKGALRTVALFPLVMLICYLSLWIYFKRKGGYEAVDLSRENSPPGDGL